MSDVSKLPKWAQQHIRTLEIERGEAVKALNRALDERTESCFSVAEHLCLGEQKGPSFKTRYIQACRAVAVKDGEHQFEIGFDNHERLVLRCLTGRLSLDPDCSNVVLISAKQ